MIKSPTKRNIFLGISILPLLVHLSQSRGKWGDWLDVRVTNDGPTTVGGKTTFIATLSKKTGQQVQFCWYSDNFKHKEKCSVGKNNDTFVKTWSSVGEKNVEVLVKQWPNPVHDARGDSKVIVTDTINAKLVALPNELYGSYQVGPVNLSVEVHDPSNLFGYYGIIYEWDFGDGASVSAKGLNTQLHNFTEDRSYNVQVFLKGWTTERSYNGSVSKKLNVQIAFNVDAKFTGRPGTFTTITNQYIYIAKGEVTIKLVYNNPYSIVKNISTDWNFGDDTPYLIHSLNKTVKHEYTKEGYYNVWITPRLITKYNTYDKQAFERTIFIKEPITQLNLTYIPESNVTNPMFIVKCDGSGPYKLCWSFIKTADTPRASLQNCTWSDNSCDFQFNDTRPPFVVGYMNVSVFSFVSQRTVLTEVPALEPTLIPTPKSSTGTTLAVETVVSLFLCGLAVLVALIYVIRKIYRSRRFAVRETADFDFRDEDCKSVDSFVIEERKGCLSLGFLRHFCKKSETIPLLAHCSGEEGKSTGNYSGENFCTLHNCAAKL